MGRLLLLQCNMCFKPVATPRGYGPPSTKTAKTTNQLALLCPDSILQLQASISPEALPVSAITALTPPVQSWLLQRKQSLREHKAFSSVSFRINNPLVSATESTKKTGIYSQRHLLFFFFLIALG